MHPKGGEINMKWRSMIFLSVCLAVLLPATVGIFVETESKNPFLGTAEGAPSTSYAAVCPSMGQSLPPCGQRELVREDYPKCTNISEGCCQYNCDYVKACDNNFYEICDSGTLMKGKNCDNASGKCY